MLSHNHRPIFLAYKRFLNFAFIRCLSNLARSPRPLDTPFRLAIVGSGPAGFYTAYRVMSRIPKAQIDMYESLPVPFGLVRYGVAPDHQEVKNCQEKFEEIASSPNFRFLGNVSVGLPSDLLGQCTLQLESLRRHYHSIVLAYGASEDKTLGIVGESTLSGIYSARQFVGWYNSHPDYAHLEPNLQGEEAIIIGQGNVALDVARMLLEDIDVLRKTDMAEYALAQLARNRIRRVHVIGRRGPMQAAFTIKEVRELMKLPRVSFYPVDRALIPEDVSSLPRASRRLMEVLLKGSPNGVDVTHKSWSLRNCLSPKAFIGNEGNPSLLRATEFEMTDLMAPFDPKSALTPTGKIITIPSDIAFRSVGYKSIPLSGFADAGIQFDQHRGIVKNDGLGRVTRLADQDISPSNADAQKAPGMYCAGWVKRGPTGVIASTMQDAFLTGDTIVTDWLSGASFLDANHDQNNMGGWDAVRQDIGSTATYAVTWDQWRRIDRAEIVRGRAKGKGREKFTTTRDMLSVIG